MENGAGNKQSNSPREKTNLDRENIQNNLNNDNSFSENGLENNRLLSKAMDQQKSE